MPWAEQWKIAPLSSLMGKTSYNSSPDLIRKCFKIGYCWERVVLDSPTLEECHSQPCCFPEQIAAGLLGTAVAFSLSNAFSRWWEPTRLSSLIANNCTYCLHFGNWKSFTLSYKICFLCAPSNVNYGGMSQAAIWQPAVLLHTSSHPRNCFTSYKHFEVIVSDIQW